MHHYRKYVILQIEIYYIIIIEVKKNSNQIQMYSQNTVDKPIHLVSVNSFGKLVLHVEALQYLSTLPAPISILSIAGPYRTGKSFLMNSLISTDTNLKAFEVGNTTNETTHGLWIWGKPILAENEEGKITSVIIMDSQGFASVEGTHDKRIVTLALLVSSCFLYNSKGSIDKDSLFDLQFVIQIARAMQTNQNKESTCQFHWILRDFHLDLVNQIGIKINSKQYMENCLFQASEKVNVKTVETFKSFFPQRDCHCLIQPNLQKGKQQRPQFTQQIIELRKIFKRIKSLNVDGCKLIKVLQSYVDAMNNGQNLSRIFQEGYDCRVRLDCMQKLNYQLKSLKDIKQKDGINKKLLGIKSEIQQYYKQRMCSHKQIKVLDEDVQQMIQQYQQENQYNLLHCKSVKVMNSSKQKYCLKIPKVTQNGIRISLNCSEADQKSFRQKQRSVQKKKVSREQKALKIKIQNLQMRNHRNELQLVGVKHQNQYLKMQIKRIQKQLEQKQVSLQEQNQSKIQIRNQLQQVIFKLKESLKQSQERCILSSSELNKLKLLSQQKIQFLQKQVAESQLNQFNLIDQVKIKYKKQIKQLQTQIETIKEKHSNQLAMIKQIYAQKEKNNENHLKQIQKNQHFYKELKCKSLMIQEYKRLIQQLKLKNTQLQTQLDDHNKRLNKKQNLHKQSLEQHHRRYSQSQKNLVQIYQSKLQAKDQLIRQLQNKIQSLSKVLFDENRNQIKKLEEKQNEHMMQKEELHQIISELRNGYLDLVKRSDYLKEENDQKQIWVDTLKKQKQLLKQRYVNLQKNEEIQKKKNKEKIQEIQISLQNHQIKISQLNQENHRFKLENQNKNNQMSRKIRQLQSKLLTQKEKYQQKCLMYSQIYNKNKQLQVIQQTYALQLEQLTKLLYQKEKCFSELSQKLQNQISIQKCQNDKIMKQKEILMKNLEKLTFKLEENYQNIEEILRQKHQQDVSKYQETVKNLKNHQRRLSKDIDQNNMEKLKLQQLCKNLQRQLNQLKTKFNQDQKLYKQLMIKNEKRIEQLNKQLFEVSKQNALLVQKLQFFRSVEQKNIKQNQKQTKQKIQNLNLTIISLNQKLIVSKQKQIQMDKDTLQLREMINILTKNQQICQQNINAIEQQKRKNNITYQNHLKLYSKKINQLKKNKDQLCKKLTQKELQYFNLMQNHDMLNKNYTVEYKSWHKNQI